MKKLISILQFYALFAYLCSPAFATTGTVENVNFLEGQATAPNFIANGSAQKNASGFKAFSDGGTTIPVNLTGGTPNTTCVRSTSGALRGDASFLMTVNSGASRQGEGCAFDPISIPPAYQGAQHVFSFPFTISGSIVSGDVIPYCYDVTNSVLVAPTFVANPLLSTSGQMIATFQVGYNPTPTSPLAMRCALYIARTSTGSLTIKANDVKFSPTQTIVGMAGSDWTQFTMSITGATTNPTKGTISSDVAYWRRVGDSMEIRYEYRQTAAGSAGSGTYQFQIPSGYSIDTTKAQAALAASSQALGSVTLWDGTTFRAGVVAIGGSNFLLLNETSTGNPVSSSLIALSNANVRYGFVASIPIAGWSSNVSMGQSSKFNVSAYLANGTRVTSFSSPCKLGEYRARYKSTTGQSGTLTDVAPTVAPSASDGMRIYGNVAGNASGTSGQISVWDVCVGQNKSVRTEFYTATGRSGAIDARFYSLSGTDIGASTAYVPSTGILTVDASWTLSSSNSSRYLGNVPGAVSLPTDGYWDAIVSENALAVGMDSPPVASYYVSASSVASSTTQPINFDSKEYDSNGAVQTGSSWKFVPPSNGTYTVCVDGSLTTTTTAYIVLYKNGSSYKWLAWSSSGNPFSNCTDLKLTTSDYFDLRTNVSVSLNGGTFGSAGTTMVTIRKSAN